VAFPDTAQEAFTAIVTAGKVPWRPADPEADQLSWAQLVQENWVPPDFANLIDQCDRIYHTHADPEPSLRWLAASYKLEYPECTL
jgi:hypothetical protein